jgi:hypothetical protein
MVLKLICLLKLENKYRTIDSMIRITHQHYKTMVTWKFTEDGTSSPCSTGADVVADARRRARRFACLPARPPSARGDSRSLRRSGGGGSGGGGPANGVPISDYNCL